MRKIGPYLIIGVDDTAELPTPAKLVLDTNVAIDLEHYYFGDRRRIDCDALRQLLLAFPRQDRRDMEVDINYGWALQETAWARDGSFRAPEVRRMAHALRRLVAWNPAQIEAVFSARRPPSDRDKSWPPPLPNPKDRGPHPLQVLIVAYAHLLHTCHLDMTRSRWRHKGLTWPIERLRNWSKNELGAYGGYELAIAATLFLENIPAGEGKVRKLMKFSGSDSPDTIADKVWNAAWDVEFLRVVDGGTYGLFGGEPEITQLATRNVDPEIIRARSQVRFIIDDDEALPTVGVYSEWGDDLKHANEIRDLMKETLDDMYARSRRDPETLLEQALAALEELETTMGIQRSTVQAFRRSIDA
ncbi:hypothetical protein [Mycobacterium avium]|uniref:hypothetical protein n=1 Tax=Mycobacterium avium TaxID=1764 RepID=UPI000A0076F9|nr:hypothetical protein [Mycobacterium avium]